MSESMFVYRWNQARSIADVAKAARISVASAYVRASRYRSRGLDLKLFPRGRKAA